MGAKSIRIARYKPNATWQGKDLFTIAELEKKTPLDIAVEITRNGGARRSSSSA